MSNPVISFPSFQEFKNSFVTCLGVGFPAHDILFEVAGVYFPSQCPGDKFADAITAFDAARAKKPAA